MRVFGALRDMVFRPYHVVLLALNDESRGTFDDLYEHVYELASRSFQERHPRYEPDDSEMVESGAKFGVTMSTLRQLNQGERVGLRWRTIRDATVRDIATNPQFYDEGCRLLARDDITFDWVHLAAADTECHAELIPLRQAIREWAEVFHMRPVDLADEWFPSIGFSTLLHWGNPRIWGNLGPNLSNDYLRVGGEAAQFSSAGPSPRYPAIRAKRPPPQPPDELLAAGWPPYRPHSHLRKFHLGKVDEWLAALAADGFGSPHIKRLNFESNEVERKTLERRARPADRRLARNARLWRKVTDPLCTHYRSLDKEYCDSLDRWFEENGCSPGYSPKRIDPVIATWALEWVVRLQLLAESGEKIASDITDTGQPKYPVRRRRAKPSEDRATHEQRAEDDAAAFVSPVTVYKTVAEHIELLAFIPRVKLPPTNAFELTEDLECGIEVSHDKSVVIVDTTQTKSPIDCPGCGAPAYRQSVEIFCPIDGSRQVTFDFHRDFTSEQYDSMLADLRAFFETLQEVKMYLRSAEPVGISDDAKKLTDFDFDMPCANPEQPWGRATPTATLINGGSQTGLSSDEIVLANETAESIIDAMVKAARQ